MDDKYKDKVIINKKESKKKKNIDKKINTVPPTPHNSPEEHIKEDSENIKIDIIHFDMSNIKNI